MTYEFIGLQQFTFKNSSVSQAVVPNSVNSSALQLLGIPIGLIVGEYSNIKRELIYLI